MLELFKYSPLRDSSEETRLITLLPASNSTDPIRCKLTHVRFKGIKDYEALSYTWGNSKSKKKILMNGKTVAVTENLQSALEHLRLESDPRIIWIDALCINQNDTKERTHQVREMHQIYSRATNVLVWLGPEENHSDLALTLIKEAGASHAIGTTFTELINTAPDLQRTALDNLLKRQYWHRVWIIQEIGLARHIKVHCGRLSIDWSYVALFFFRLQNLGRRVDGSFLQDIRRSMPANLQPIWRFCHQNSINITLRSLLGASLHSVCQDPRDKIYGLLALVRKGVKTRILIDYKKTLAEALSDMVISMEPDSRDEVLQGRFKDYGRYTDYNAVYLESYLLSFMCAFHKSLRSIIQAKPPEELLSPTMREMLDFSFAECHPGKWIPAIRLGKILKLMPADVQSREEQRVFSIASTLCYGFHTIKKCSTCQAKPSDQRCLHKNDYRRYPGPKETGVVKTSVKSTFLQEDGDH